MTFGFPTVFRIKTKTQYDKYSLLKSLSITSPVLLPQCTFLAIILSICQALSHSILLYNISSWLFPQSPSPLAACWTQCPFSKVCPAFKVRKHMLMLSLQPASPITLAPPGLGVPDGVRVAALRGTEITKQVPSRLMSQALSVNLSCFSEASHRPVPLLLLQPQPAESMDSCLYLSSVSLLASIAKHSPSPGSLTWCPPAQLVPFHRQMKTDVADRNSRVQQGFVAILGWRKNSGDLPGFSTPGTSSDWQ